MEEPGEDLLGICVCQLLAEIPGAEQRGIVGFFQQPTREIFLVPLRRFEDFDGGNGRSLFG